MTIENNLREAFRQRAALARPSKHAWSSIRRRLEVDAASMTDGGGIASGRAVQVIDLIGHAHLEDAKEVITARGRVRGFVTSKDALSGPRDDAPVRRVLLSDDRVWRDGVRADLDRLGIGVTVGETSDGADAIKAGACGYLLKSATPAEIADAVARVTRGEPVITPSLAGLVLSEFRMGTAPEGGDPTLTARENEVLRLVAKGYAYREIARKLFISVKTVQNHLQNILTKLRLGQRHDLICYAIEKGIDRLPE
jgi:DNA-binding CsgD family transcriptional regulator